MLVILFACVWSTTLFSQTTIADNKVVLVADERMPNGGLVEQSPRFNLYLNPLVLIVSQFKGVDVGLDYKVADYITVGVGLRTANWLSGINDDVADYTSERSFRLQAEAYTGGSVFRSSFVVQAKAGLSRLEPYREVGTKPYDVPFEIFSLGALIGHRWFWTDPGEPGINLAILGGANVYFLNVPYVETSAVGPVAIPELRVDVGYTF